jgi:hypothetical protein
MTQVFQAKVGVFGLDDAAEHIDEKPVRDLNVLRFPSGDLISEEPYPPCYLSYSINVEVSVGQSSLLNLDLFTCRKRQTIHIETRPENPFGLDLGVALSRGQQLPIEVYRDRLAEGESGSQQTPDPSRLEIAPGGLQR